MGGAYGKERSAPAEKHREEGRLEKYLGQMILDKIKEAGENLKLPEGHDLQYPVYKAKEVEPVRCPKTETNLIPWMQVNFDNRWC